MSSPVSSSPTQQARAIVRVLQDAFNAREGVFDDTKELLENQIPPGVAPLSREHGNFLFFLISQDHGTKSARLYERAKVLYTRAAEYFDPAFVASQCRSDEDEGLLAFISQLGVRYPRMARKGWVRNSARLADEFHGDARLVFQAHATASNTIRLIRSFYGFGPKISGLLFRVFLGTGLAQGLEIDGVVFPTDIHDTRIAALTGIADIPSDITEGDYSPYVRRAEEAWRQACLNERVDWLQVDRALWILGSKGCVAERHSDCPIRTFCRRGQVTIL